MSYYSDLGLLSGGSSYPSLYIPGPYSNHSSIIAANFTRPSHSLLKPFQRNFRNYKPHLATITERTHSPLGRVNSPKLNSTFQIPRPININTADIDVSVNKYRKYDRPNRQKSETPSAKKIIENSGAKSPSPSKSVEKSLSPNRTLTKSPSPSETLKKSSSPSRTPENSSSNLTTEKSSSLSKTPEKKPEEARESPAGSLKQHDAKPNKIIRRDRPTVRLHTIHKGNVPRAFNTYRKWRDNFDPKELYLEEAPVKTTRKTPGELLKEKFLIRNKNEDSTEKPNSQTVVEKPPSFHEICRAISSEKVDEVLNPGQPEVIRRKQSRRLSSEDLLKHIQRNSAELSKEEVLMLDTLLNSENLQMEPIKEDENARPTKSVGDEGYDSRGSHKRKKKISKKKSNESLIYDSKSDNSDSERPRTTLQRRPTLKRIRRTSTNSSVGSEAIDDEVKELYQHAIRDISQVEIEEIKAKPKPIVTATVEVDQKVKPSLKAVIDEVEVEEVPKPTKSNRRKFNVTVEEVEDKRRSLNKQAIEVKRRNEGKYPKTILTEDQFGVVQIPKPKEPIVSNILVKRDQAYKGSVPNEEKKAKKAPKSPTLSQFEKAECQEKPIDEDVSKVLSQNVSKSRSVDNVPAQMIALAKVKSEDDVPSPKLPNKQINISGRSTPTKEKQEKKDHKLPASPPLELKSDPESPVKVETTVVKNLDKVDIQSTPTEEADEKKEPKPLVPLPVTLQSDLESPVKIETPVVEDLDKIVLQPVPKSKSVENALAQKVVFRKAVSEDNKESPVTSPKISDRQIDMSDVLYKGEREIDKISNLKLQKTDSRTRISRNEPVDKSEEAKPESPTPTSGHELQKVPSKSSLKAQGAAKSYVTKKVTMKDLKECDSEDKTTEDETPKEEAQPEIETVEKPAGKITSKRSLVYKSDKVDDPDLEVFKPPEPEPSEEEEKEIKDETEEKDAFVPLQSNRLSQWMHPWKKPEPQDEQLDIYATPKVIRKRHYPRPRGHPAAIAESSSSEEEESSSEESTSDEEDEDDTQTRSESGKVGASTSSNDSGFHSGAKGSRNNDCDVNCHKKCEKLTANLCGINQKLVVEAIASVKRGSSSESRESPTSNSINNAALALDSIDPSDDYTKSSTFIGFQKSGRITPPATTIPRFRKYSIEDFNLLKVLGKGSFGKVLLAELKNTEYYYAIKCLKKDVVLEDDDVECTLIERKVLALGTKHPYLCHLLCTFQTESHLFFVMEYLNGGDLMFHIQQSGRFSEDRARFYGAEIVSGLKFLHNKGIVYRDLKLDNILLDYDGHVRIADFGMCKLQIFLDRMADTFCGTPDYMAPEIIKGQHYNQSVDWWSFGVLLYEMLLGQSPFSGCDEDELFWSICNEKPVLPRFLSGDAREILSRFLEKDASKRLGNRFCSYGDIQDQPFFQPIDWQRLESRQLEAPFKPRLLHPLDTQYFDKTFTTEKAKLTPIDERILQSMDQAQFQGFSYTNPNATDK